MTSKCLTTACIVGCAALALLWGCPGAQPPTECAGLNEACASDSTCCEGLECIDGVCASPPPSAPQPAIPAKSISYDLVGIHDPDSDAYSDDCIGCHGDRTAEVAQDGVTPAAHATMVAFFGTGNRRCVACHQSGPDFLTLSAGGLREQVDMERANCAGCHGVIAPTGAPTFYAE